MEKKREKETSLLVLLTPLESSGLNFIGNVEAKVVFAEKRMFSVTDGFTGKYFETSEAVQKCVRYAEGKSVSSLKTKIVRYLQRCI
jgi:fatty acid/phospholipid biosynthesis enzyme